MEHFSVGFLSFVLALAFAGLYLGFRQLRRLGAWVQREEGPKERIGAMVVIFLLLGFVAGSLAQPLWDKGVECRLSGKPIFACVFLP